MQNALNKNDKFSKEGNHKRLGRDNKHASQNKREEQGGGRDVMKNTPGTKSDEQ